VVGLAKLAAASIDDVAGQAAKAGAKAAGVVIDDAAVTPRYVVGFAAARELPIIGRIAAGSLRNKLLVLLPAALALSLLAPWAITPLLMIGGAYLCYEGTEKAFEALFPQRAHEHEAHLASVALNPKTLEDEKVASAIKTDFILSAEIMAITLAAIPATSFVSQSVTLAIVAIGITAIVYGGVAIIVKADDLGLMLANQGSSSFGRQLVSWFGRGIVRGMPIFLWVLAFVGTAAMIWVGGGILVHGFEEYGFSGVAHAIDWLAEIAAHAIPPLGSVIQWLITAAGAGLVGLLVGAALIPITEYVFAPVWKWVTARRMVA
jgi:predicted DNA repair protein MutK